MSDIPITVNYFVISQQLEMVKFLIQRMRTDEAVKLTEKIIKQLDEKLEPEVLRSIKNQ